MMTIPELDQYIAERIQGVFSQQDMAVLKKEIEKLEPGDIYVEIGVDEGRSARVAHEYAKEGVYKIWIDIHDPSSKPVKMSRAEFMEKEGMVGIGKRGFYIHGDADKFAEAWWLISPAGMIDLLFIDGHHNYESVKKNTLCWEGLVNPGGVILFHDTDHEDVLRWLNEHYKNNWENLHGKIGRVRL